MTSIRSIFLPFCFFCLLISACGKDDDPTPTVSKGIISGTVDVYDDKLTSLSDKSGFTVTISNLSGKTAVTDAAGKFTFTDVPYDSYDLSFSKTGYGTYKSFGVNHQSSSSIIPTVSLGAVSTTSVTALAFANNTYNGSPGVSYIYSTSPSPTTLNRGYVRVFFGSTSAVSSTNYINFSSTRGNASNNITGGFTADELYGLGLKPGQTVFLKLYGESVFSNAYDDPATGKFVFPNLNTTSPAAISFIVP